MSFNGITVDSAHFTASLRQLSALNQRSQAENLQRFARTTLSNPQGSGLLQITPPASAGSTGAAAKRAGEMAIERDLSAVFTGVQIKHKRAEQWPDVDGIHLRLFLYKRPGAKLRSDKGRGFYHVDRAKLKALALKLKGRVGRLAAGWLVACRALGVRAPAWIARHGGGAGEYREKLAAPRYEIEMTCIAPPNAPADELDRRVSYALRYTDERIAREIEFHLGRDARRAGFKTAA